MTADLVSPLHLGNPESELYPSPWKSDSKHGRNSYPLGSISYLTAIFLSFEERSKDLTFPESVVITNSLLGLEIILECSVTEYFLLIVIRTFQRGIFSWYEVIVAHADEQFLLLFPQCKGAQLSGSPPQECQTNLSQSVQPGLHRRSTCLQWSLLRFAV